MHTITIASPFVKQSLVGAIEKGYDVNSVLQSCGIAPRILSQPKARVSVQQVMQLTTKLVKLMDDEAIGLLERPLRRGNLKMMGYALITAANAGESWRRACQYQNLFENSFVAELIEREERAIYQLKRRSGHTVKNSLIIEQHLMTLHRFHTWLTGNRIPLRRVLLDYPQPDHVGEYRYLFYGAPVLFNQAHSCIEFDRSALQLPNRQTKENLELFIQRAPLDLFTPLSASNTLRARIRSWLEQQMREKQQLPSIDETGQQFDMTPQTMRRRLQKEGSSYQSIKDNARRDWAIHLLNESSDSVEEIGYQVGFSEPSAFIRAFKTWTGLTPLSYRKN